MTETATARELLIVALQDLYDAEQAVIERTPSLEAGISASLAGYLSEEQERARVQAARLKALLDALGAPATDAPNIWLRATLDDAARDYETIVPGNLRDIALVGAFRKAKQAERVSYETAIGLARVLGEGNAAASLKTCRDEEQAADDDLIGLLRKLLATLGGDRSENDGEKSTG